MQALSAAIQRYGHLLICHMYIQQNIRNLRTDAGTFMRLIDPVVRDRIFDAIGNEPAISEGLAIDGCIDGECLICRHVLTPIQGFDLIVKGICIFGFKRSDRHQNADSGAQTKVRTV